MKIDLRNQFISHPRYSRYLAATANDNARAKRLYTANIRLAQAFHPILSQFEVVIRNSLHTTLTRHFADPNWIINQKNGFMRNPSLHSSNFFLRSCVQKAENKLRFRGIPVTSGKIISDQTFGFWVAFFLPHHYSLIGGQPIYAFPNKPSVENRASIHRKLENIKAFRNRVNHCEPICFTGTVTDCTTALNVRNELYELIEWIHPDVVPFFSDLDNIVSKANHALSM